MDEMALAIGEKIRLDTLPSSTALTFCFLVKSEALAFPFRVNNFVRLFKLLLENNKLPNFIFNEGIRVGIHIVFRCSSKCTPCKWSASLILTRRL